MLGVQEEAEEDDNSSLSVPLPGLEITPTEQCQLMLEDNALHCQPNTTNIVSYTHFIYNVKFYYFCMYRSFVVGCGVEKTTNQIADIIISHLRLVQSVL